MIRPENHGPTLTVVTTSAIVAGTTSGYTEYELFGPIQIISDTVFASGCVMHAKGGDKPGTGTTYPAGFTLYKYFTTVQLTSGAIEIVAHRDKEELGFE